MVHMSETLVPLTREMLWPNFRDYRDLTSSGKPFFLSLGRTDFLRLGIGVWEGPSMSITREHGVSFPLRTGTFFPVELERVQRDVSSNNVLGNVSESDLLKMVSMLCRDRIDIVVGADGRVLKKFNVSKYSIGALSDVSLAMMPIPYEITQPTPFDEESNRMPLAIAELTDSGYPKLVEETFIPAEPIPVFVER